MKKSGNGDPKRCCENLVSIIRGEVPFDRVRGMDARTIDKPESDARFEFEADARWNIETYEPRVNADKTEITVNDAPGGGFTLDIEISEVADDEEM